MSIGSGIDSVVEFIHSEECRSICVLVGPGINVGSVPDFRSPAGMSDSLRTERLTATEDQRRDFSVNPSLVLETFLDSIVPEAHIPYHEARLTVAYEDV